jgi:hypothetical protein
MKSQALALLAGIALGILASQIFGNMADRTNNPSDLIVMNDPNSELGLTEQAPPENSATEKQAEESEKISLGVATLDECRGKIQDLQNQVTALESERDDQHFQERNLEDSPEFRLKLARDYLEVTDFSQLMEDSLSAMSEALVNEGNKGSSAQGNAANAMEIVSKNILDEEFYQSMEKIYSDIYTPFELNALVRFHQSEVGQSYLKKNPELMKETFRVLQQQIASKMDIVKAELRESATSQKKDAKL